MVKVAFIGAGSRAQSAHYPAVHRVADAQVQAVAELSAERMQRVVEKYHIPRTFTDHHEMLKTVDLDAVYVIMGADFMTGPALDCLNAGKHVFIEKPAGGNSDDTHRLLEAARAKNLCCMVGYQRRYAAVTREAM